jgi:cobalt/nickel transport system permease protein
VVEDLGFLEIGQSAPFEILSDYQISFLGETNLSTILAGVVGVIILMGVLTLFGRNLRKPRKS